MTPSPIKDNELRHKILETMQEYDIDPHMCNDDSCAASNLHVQGIDAILTAIIDSLPSEEVKDTDGDYEPDFWLGKYVYKEEVEDLLTNAKSNKGVN